MRKVYVEIPTTNGRVRYHILHGEHERADNLNIAKYFAEKYGHKIDLLPIDNRRASADAYNHTLGVKQEYKVNRKPTKSAIDNEIRSAKKQADHIVILILSNIAANSLRNGIQDRVCRSATIQTVTVIWQGRDKMYSREQILRQDFSL
jgi:hypothetical protein